MKGVLGPVGLLVLVALLPGCSPAGADPESGVDFAAIRLEWAGGSAPAALAADDRARSRGYRHRELDHAPPALYFHYPSPREVSFHMRQVSFSVRAWWLDEQGCIKGFTDMAPGTEGHDSPGRIKAVLEVPRSRLDDYPLETGDCIDWSRP